GVGCGGGAGVWGGGGGSLGATGSGRWSPLPGGVAGTAPADYGGKFDAVIDTEFVALHDMTVPTKHSVNPPRSRPLAGVCARQWPPRRAWANPVAQTGVSHVLEMAAHDPTEVAWRRAPAGPAHPPPPHGFFPPAPGPR